VLVVTADCAGTVTATVSVDSTTITGTVTDWWADGKGKGLPTGAAPQTGSFTAANGAKLHIGVNVSLSNGLGSSPTADVIVPAPCVDTTVATTVAPTTTTVQPTTVATTVAPSTTVTIPGSTLSPTTTDDSPTEETIGSTPKPTLPRTGAGSGSTPYWAGLLLLLGVLLVWAGRRKRSPIAS
jgi:LPXTG-motif cell wall-anchored protein